LREWKTTFRENTLSVIFNQGFYNFGLDLKSKVINSTSGMLSPSVSKSPTPKRKQIRTNHQLEDVFHLNQSLEEKVKPTAANETI